MAKKKEASRRGLENRESGHSETGFSGSRGKATRSSGSYAHVGERVGPGEVAGAGEMHPREAGSSGAESRSSMPEDRYPSRKTPGAKERVSNRSRGQEEDE